MTMVDPHDIAFLEIAQRDWDETYIVGVALIRLLNQIDCKAGTKAEGQNLLVNISTSRASLLQGQYLIKEN